MIDSAWLWPIALAMAAGIAALVRWAAEARAAAEAGLPLFLLAMMAAMLAGAVVGLSSPTAKPLALAIGVSGVGMALAALAYFGLRLAGLGRNPSSTLPSPAPGPRTPWAGAGCAVVLVLANELLMAWAFGLASGGNLSFGPIGLLASLVGSPWFLVPMGLEMGLSVYLLRRRLPRLAYAVLLGQALIMLLSPPAFPAGPERTGALIGSSAAMVALFVLVLESVYRVRSYPAGVAGYLPRLLVVYAAMMAGLFAWLLYGRLDLFAVAVLAEMVVFFSAVVRPHTFSTGEPTPLLLRPRWVATVLGSILVAELFMGAALDAVLTGPAFLQLIPSAAVSGGFGPALENAVSNGFWFVALVTGSAWFLIMMGLEMGGLVAFKLRETRHRELQVRLALMLAAFGAVTVYLPSFWATLPISPLPAIASVPVIGWSMGVGSSGPLAPTFFVAILATYAAIGALSVLFGRRVLCSTLCSAAVMYQGTAIDSMKSFNRSSPFARRYLGSKFSALYTWAAAASLVSVAGGSVISYLDSVGTLRWSILGSDPSQFLFALYFGVLWYAMFVAIPYAGTYNCVTMGWCHWGTFSQVFSRIGFFRLKVRDRDVCRACTTLDCAKACPIGLVDMVGGFRTNGEFRSSKCCGVGDCVGACPYDNLYIHDVRHWVSRRWSRTPRAEIQLPIVPAAPRPGVGAVPRVTPARGLVRTEPGEAIA